MNKKLLLYILPILRLLSIFIIKKKLRITFHSIPDLSGNSKAFFNYLYQQEKYDLIWAFSNKYLEEKFNNKYPNSTSVSLSSLKGIYLILTSKTLVTTHNVLRLFKAKNQKHLSLWHGMPLKSMGFMIDQRSAKPEPLVKTDHIVSNMFATSTITKTLLSSALYINPQKVLITGQTRNDQLFNKKLAIKNLEKLLNMSINDKKIIFFLPTFRQGFKNRTDGDLIKKNNLFRLDDYSHTKFCNFLENENYLLIAKLHPFEENTIDTNINQNNFRLLKQATLDDKLVDLYEILGAGDLLITDYSSIYFDTLLINMPNIFSIPDFDKYKNSRGFTLSPFDFWTPGPKTKNMNNLLIEIKNSLKNKSYFLDQRKQVNDIINEIQDDSACSTLETLLF